MTTESSVSPVNARLWSATLLEVEESSSRSALLKYVTASDYIVSADRADALQILTNPQALVLQPNVIQRAERCGFENQMQAGVSKFAKSYFEMPHLERREHWQTLFTDCEQFPGLLSWLKDLEPALDVEQVHIAEDQHLNSFVQLCCQVFVARGIEQARMRQDIVRTYCENSDNWERVVKRLQYEHSYFVNNVAPWVNILEESRRSELLNDAPLLVMPVATATSQQAPTLNGNWWTGIAVFAIANAVFRLITSSGSPSPSYQPPTIPPYATPAVVPNDPPVELLKNHTPEQPKQTTRRLYKSFERRQDADRSGKQRTTTGQQEQLAPGNPSQLPISEQ